MPEKKENLETDAAAEDEPKEEKEKSNEVQPIPGFTNIRLTQDEEKEVYLDLAEFLLEKSLCFLSNQTLEYISDKDYSVRVIFCQTKAKMLQLKYSEAAEDLHHLFSNVDSNMTEAYVLHGHCKFLLGEFDEALDSYYKAIRIANL
mmetsp:Transcript_22914/g.35247  ORF Transcript_22914/g.35247 Transcript_22914/m.35247 type:complete len:146 (+) Transcript_22914:2102-2539(+)